jgi:hypothetical protein
MNNIFTNLTRKPKKGKELTFYQELEDSFYNKYPEEWEKEKHYAVGVEFVAILNGQSDRVSISKYKGEIATFEYIKRAKRMLWQVGNIYHVAERMNIATNHTLYQNENRGTFEQVISPDKSLGLIRLIEIIPKKTENLLVFEKHE